MRGKVGQRYECRGGDDVDRDERDGNHDDAVEGCPASLENVEGDEHQEREDKGAGRRGARRRGTREGRSGEVSQRDECRRAGNRLAAVDTFNVPDVADGDGDGVMLMYLAAIWSYRREEMV